MLKPRSTVSLLVLAASLVAQERDDERKAKPDPLAAAWQLALEQAKTHKAPILAFVLPPADAMAAPRQAKRTWESECDIGILRAYRELGPSIGSARELMLRQVQLLRATDHPEGGAFHSDIEVSNTRGTAVFALTIPVVATAATCGAEPGETAVLFGPDGKRVCGFKTGLLDAELFLAEVGAVVLEPMALAARAANVPPAIARDVAALPAEKAGSISYFGDHEVAKRLVMNLPGAAPALVRWGDRRLYMHHMLCVLEDERVPLGTEWQRGLGSLCPCGTGFTPPSLNGALKLIGP